MLYARTTLLLCVAGLLVLAPLAVGTRQLYAERASDVAPQGQTFVCAVGRGTLVGVRSVCVPVTLSGECENFGLTENRIRTAVELRLRQNAVPILSLDDAREFLTGRHSVNDYCRLVVSVVVSTGQGFSATTTSVDFYQPVVPLRNLRSKDTFFCEGVTWRRQTTQLCTTDQIRNKCEENIEDAIDEFCNDYLAANPRSPPGPQTGGLDGLPKAIEPSVKQNDRNRP